MGKSEGKRLLGKAGCRRYDNLSLKTSARRTWTGLISVRKGSSGGLL